MGDSGPLNLSVGVFSGVGVQTGLPKFFRGDSKWPAYSQLMNAMSAKIEIPGIFLFSVFFGWLKLVIWLN